MGGPPTAGIGWAGGMERLAELISPDLVPAESRPIAIIPVGADCQIAALTLAQKLRQSGFSVDMSYRGNMGKRMKRANKAGSVAAVLIGEDELKRGAVTVKNFDDGSQTEVALDQIIDHLSHYH